MIAGELQAWLLGLIAAYCVRAWKDRDPSRMTWRIRMSITSETMLALEAMAEGAAALAGWERSAASGQPVANGQTRRSVRQRHR